MKGYPLRYVVFDTETSEHTSTRKGWHKEQVLRLGVAKIYDPVVNPTGTPLYARFSTPREFQDVLDQMPPSKDPIYLFAHNIGFDVRIVDWFSYVTRGRYSLLPPADMPGAGRYKSPLFVCDGHPTLMRFFRSDHQQFRLWDSFNWMPWKLQVVGDMVGMKKGTIDFKSCTEEQLYEYCQGDVDVLDRALRHLWGWLQCLRVSDWAATPASQAAQLYRMRYSKGRIKRPPDQACTSLDRMGYYGGVVEPFRVGRYDRQCYSVDCNGLYPYVMKHNRYPCEVLAHDTGDIRSRRDVLPEFDSITAEVYLETGQWAYPIRTRSGTLSCRGRVHTVLCGPELRRAEQRGHIRNIGRWVQFRLDDLFSAYVDTFWRLRQRARERGDELIQHTCKHLLNSLHGKFGQRGGEWQYTGRTETPGYYGCGQVLRPDEDRKIEARVLDGHMFQRLLDDDDKDSFVPIAAWTASYARVFMEEVIDMLGHDNVLYQCCDALILTQDGYDRLHEAGMCDTGRMGDFKTEDSFKWIDIQGPNQLDHCHGWKHSGVKQGSGAVADGIYRVEEWETAAAAIFSGNVGSAFTRETLVPTSKTYSRRHVNADGSTIPWAIDNWSCSLDQLSRWSPNLRDSAGK